MREVLVGWNDIFNFLGVNFYKIDKKPLESWQGWEKRVGEGLIKKGFPVFFLLDIDKEPRLYVPELIKWARSWTESIFLDIHYKMIDEEERAKIEKDKEEPSGK